MHDLDARVAKLELERPAFVLELESLVDTAHEILGRAEGKRARATALESKAKKREEEQQPELATREDLKAQVRALHVPSWRR